MLEAIPDLRARILGLEVDPSLKGSKQSDINERQGDSSALTRVPTDDVPLKTRCPTAWRWIGASDD
jgi:hypothetical protein